MKNLPCLVAMPPKRKGKGKKGKKSTSAVGELVGSIKKHRKFRQLASYSVQCLQQVITPPRVGWEQAREEAYAAGAMDAITDVLERHKGDPNVLAASTACLSSIASEPKYAGELVSSGALMSMLNSVKEQPDAKEGVKETLQLLEIVATHNPEALVEHAGVQAVADLLANAEGHESIRSTCMFTLEQLNKVPGGSKSIIDAGLVPTLMDELKKPVEAFESPESMTMLETSIRMLDRLCRSSEHAEYIRGECDGMEVLSNALETHASNERVCKLGGSVLNRLASGNISDLIQRMEATEKPKEREFLAGLLANLALEDENAEKIVSDNGIPALLNTLSLPNPRTITASSRAIGRIAQDVSNIDDLVRAGAVSSLVSAMDANRGYPEILASIIPTLVRFASNSEHVDVVVREGGVSAILQALTTHQDNEQQSAEALAFLENLGTIDFDMASLVRDGAIQAVVAAMRSHEDNHELQLNGARCLVYMSYSKTNVQVMLDNGVLIPINKALQSKHASLTKTAMYFLGGVCLLDGGKEQVQAAGVVDSFLTAIATHSHKSEGVKVAAQELMAGLVEAPQVAETWSSINAQLEELLSSKRPEAAKQFIAMVQRAGAFSIVPTNAEIIVRAEEGGGDGMGLRALVGAIGRIASCKGLPKQESILVACSNALFDINDCVQHDEELRETLASTGAVQSVITSIKQLPKLKGHVRSGVRFLEGFASIPQSATVIAKEGGVEACVAVMRANPTDHEVCDSAVNTLLQLAATDSGAVQVARHGGTRQVIAAVTDNVNTPDFDSTMERCLQLLQRVALTSEGASVLVKQGGVDAVIAATDAVASATMADASSRVLSRLVVPEDVDNVLDDLDEAVAEGAAGGGGVEAVKPILSRLGHLASVGDYSAVISEGGGVRALMTLVKGAVEGEDEDARAELLPTAMRTLAAVSRSADLENPEEVVGYVKFCLENDVGVNNTLQVVKHLAARSEAAAQAILQDGSVLELIVQRFRTNQRSPEAVAACLGALDALASHNSTAGTVAASQALSLVQGYLDDSLDRDADEQTVLALHAVSNFCRAPEAATAVMAEGGALDLLKEVVSKHCMGAGQAQPKVLGGCVQVLERLGATPEGVARLSGGGAVKRVVRAVASHGDYVQSGECMHSVMSLVNACATHGDAEVVSQLQDQGALHMVQAAMTKNGNDSKLVEEGARALTSLGAGAEVARIALEDLRSVSARVEAGETGVAVMAELGEAVQQVSNFMLLEGTVTVENTGEYMTTLSSAVSMMAEHEVAPEMVASGVQAMGRLVATHGQRVEEVRAKGGEVPPEALNLHEAVEMTMDVLAVQPDAVAVREACVHTLGVMAQGGGAQAVTAMSDLGAMELMVDISKANPGDNQLQELVTSAVQSVTSVTNDHVAELVAQQDSAALVSVVTANAVDPQKLAESLGQISQAQAGEQALWSILTASGERAVEATAAAVEAEEGEVVAGVAVQAEVTCEALRVLSDMVLEPEPEEEGQVVERSHIPGDPMRVEAVSHALRQALQAQKRLNEGSDMRSRMQALTLTETSLAVMERMDMTPTGTATLIEGGGLGALQELLVANFADRPTVERILGVVSNAVATGHRGMAEEAAKPAMMQQLVAAMRDHADDPAISALAANCVANVVQALGPDQCGVEREGLRAVMSLQTKYAGNAEAVAVTSSCDAVVGALASKFSDDSSMQMKQSFGTAAARIKEVGTLKAVKTETGEVSFVDASTGAAAAASAVQAVDQVKSTLAAVAEAAKVQGEQEGVVAMEEADVAHVCEALSSFAPSAELATAAAQTLASISTNDDNVKAIARSGGIGGIIAALRANPDDVELLRLLLTLLERISRDDAFKAPIRDAGGIEVVIEIGIGRHVALCDIATRCCSTLANLAFNSKENIELITAHGGVRAVERCMEDHHGDKKLLENALCALSNFMFASDDVKEEVGERAADNIVDIITEHGKEEAALFKMALRALGNLCYLDSNIRLTADELHGTEAIVQAASAHPKDEEVLQLAMEVLANFASHDLEAETAAREAAGEEEAELASIPSIVFEEGGSLAIIHTLQRNKHNSTLIKAGLDALANIANDIDIAAAMAEEQGLTALVIDVMQTLEWDQELMAHTVPLVAALAESQEAGRSIAQLDGIPVLLQVLEQHGGSSEDMLFSGALALSALATHEETRAAVAHFNMHEGMFTLIEQYEDNKLFVTEMLTCLTRLCAEDELSAAIGQHGMHIIMRAVEAFKDDEEFLTVAFRLLGHLAFVPANLSQIVQMGGVAKVIEAIINHPDCQALMVRAIRTLDNLSMSSKENAQLVIEEGGKDLIETIMASYEHDDEIQRSGRSAILSMSALENLAKSADITAKAAKQAKKKGKADGPTDPLEGVRHMLSAGKLVQVWSGGRPKGAHVLVSPDFRSIVWQDPKTHAKMGAMDLRSVLDVKAGQGPGHKKRMLGRAADPDKCITVTGERASLDMETNVSAEVKTWVEALGRLLHVFRTNPQAL